MLLVYLLWSPCYLNVVCKPQNAAKPSAPSAQAPSAVAAAPAPKGKFDEYHAYLDKLQAERDAAAAAAAGAAGGGLSPAPHRAGLVKKPAAGGDAPGDVVWDPGMAAMRGQQAG